MIPALVLTAGLATRLRPLSFVRAKAALPVAGEPLARRILRQLAAGGVTDAVLNLHHLPHTLTGVIGDGADIGVRVRYSWETPVLGSAGGPRRALPLLGSSPFLIVNGDTLTDVDLDALVEAHQQSGALVTLAVVPNTEPDKYSGVALEDGAFTRVVKRGAPEASYHFIGVQVANAEAFASLADGVPANSLGAPLYQDLIRVRRGAVRGHVTAAEFFDIGTPADYLQTSLLLGQRDGRPGSHGARTRIAADARVIDSVLWDDVDVGAGAMVRECVVCDGARIPPDTSWHGVSIRNVRLPESSGLHVVPMAPGERRIGDLAIASL